MRIDGLSGMLGLVAVLGLLFVAYQMGRNQVFG